MEKLFRKNVPHILERIFFSLDYDSFMECSKVCKEWNKLLSSDRYRSEAEKMLTMLTEKKRIQER